MNDKKQAAKQNTRIKKWYESRKTKVNSSNCKYKGIRTQIQRYSNINNGTKRVKEFFVLEQQNDK